MALGVNIPTWQLRDAQAYLRIDSAGANVETSLGAKVPLDHVTRALAIVRRLKASGQTYQRNGHTIHLGVYALDSMDVDGNIIAGCHHIAWSEVERLGATLDARHKVLDTRHKANEPEPEPETLSEPEPVSEASGAGPMGAGAGADLKVSCQ